MPTRKKVEKKRPLTPSQRMRKALAKPENQAKVKAALEKMGLLKIPTEEEKAQEPRERVQTSRYLAASPEMQATLEKNRARSHQIVARILAAQTQRDQTQELRKETNLNNAEAAKSCALAATKKGKQ